MTLSEYLSIIKNLKIFQETGPLRNFLHVCAEYPKETRNPIIDPNSDNGKQIKMQPINKSKNKNTIKIVVLKEKDSEITRETEVWREEEREGMIIPLISMMIAPRTDSEVSPR